MRRSRARAKVLILDCCYAGAFKAADAELPEGLQGEGLFWLFSSGPTERSKAATREGEPSPFTARLSEALRLKSLDENHDGFISFEDVYFYLDRCFRSLELPSPVRMLPSPTIGTVALARSRRADAGEAAPATSAATASPATPLLPSSVIIPDETPQLAPVPPQRPRFEMSRYHVTNRQFFSFLNDPANAGWRRHGSDARRHADEHYLEGWPGGRLPPELSQHPVVSVSPAAAHAYARWAGRRLRRPLRLPTVSEWRLAARAGRAGDWLAEDIELGRVNYNRTANDLSGVGEFALNPYGIADLLGNAHDLCLRDDPTGTGTGLVACGGAYWARAGQLEAVLPVRAYECRADTGFRCVYDLASTQGGDSDA